MDQLLAVKIGCLAGVLLITLLCGLIPAQVKWFHINMARGKHRRILSFISCFAAGVFLGACIMHMVADALGDIETEIRKRQHMVSAVLRRYPYGELVISLGFFLVFFIESVVLHCCPQAVHSHNNQENHEEHKEPPPSHSSFRAFILFLSLSFHSVFEGLAIGVQKETTDTIQLCLAVLIHKAIMSFSLSLKLVQSSTKLQWRILYLVVFVLMSPIGISIGIGVSLSNGDGSGLAQAVLEGVSAGTFLYITFLEILPYELASHESPFTKFLFISLGFSIMAVIAIWA
uniref:Solute carrier family 39 member 2 n=1 Tax=Pseudonaja textilis TaxID=8673 RepID=A0A670ZN26_PSETE